MMILGIAGPMGSGKDTVARILVENFGVIPVSFGAFIRLTCVHRGLEMTRENLQRIGDELRKRGVLPKMVIYYAQLIEKRGLDVVITDVRLLEEYEHLRRVGAKIIGVYAPKELRYERLRKRARNGDALTWEEFERLSQHPTELEAEQIALKLADYIIFNTSTLDKLEEDVIDVGLKLNLRVRNSKIRRVALLIYRSLQLLSKSAEELRRMFFEQKDAAALLSLLALKLELPPYLFVLDLI